MPIKMKTLILPNSGIPRDTYKVTANGEIHSFAYGRRRILKQTRKKNGYMCIRLWHNGGIKNFLVHRIVAATYFGVSLLPVNHIDGNRSNNKCENLEYCTTSYNKLHSIRTLKMLPVSCMRTQENLAKAKKLLKSGMSFRRIAKALGVTHTTVSRWIKEDHATRG